MFDVDWIGIREAKRRVIYLLTDPRQDSIICYVGQTKTVDRFKEHFKRDKWLGTPKRAWIDQILDAGLLPEIHLLETCEDAEADDRESYWIRVYEFSPFHILANGYIERTSAKRARVHDVAPPMVGRKPGIVTDILFIVELLRYQSWLMKKVAVPATLTRDVNISLPSWHYWEDRINGRRLSIVNPTNSYMQHLFVTCDQSMDDSLGIVTGATESSDAELTRRRLGVCAAEDDLALTLLVSLGLWDTLPTELRNRLSAA